MKTIYKLAAYNNKILGNFVQLSVFKTYMLRQYYGNVR